MKTAVTVAGHALSEFGAKMQSYPKISAHEPSIGVFQGIGRSTMQVLQNQRTERVMECKIDFLSKKAEERAQNQSDFDALFTGRVPVEIDIGDGFVYDAILTEADTVDTEQDFILTVKYKFRVIRRKALVTLQAKSALTSNAEDSPSSIYCLSNFPKTDCIICLPISRWSDASKVLVELGTECWGYEPVLSGDLVLDGIHKIFTVGNKNITADIEWTDFPYLMPGENKICVSVQGVPVPNNLVEVRYYPTFL